MDEIKITSSFKQFNSSDDLNPEDRNLLNEARKAVSKAYAPYSKFNVGAAVLLNDGTIICGNNQENASYPLGLCAERVAIFFAGAEYPDKKIKAIAISASSKEFLIDKPVTPCGACRQAISEYEHRHQQKIKLIMQGEDGKILMTDTVNNFLPLQFTGDQLKPKGEKE